MLRVRNLLPSVAVLCVLSGAAHAALVTSPSDLNPGDQYRLIFVTTGKTQASSSSISFYDAHVTSNLSPTLSALTSNWLAVASTDPNPGSGTEVNARDHTSTVPGTDGAGIPIYNVNDQRLANSYQDLWDGSVATGVRYDAFGDNIPQTRVWTGTSSSGTDMNYDSLGWGSARYGVSTATFSQWIDNGGSASWSNLYAVYGISDVLTVQGTVPEPSSVIGLVGMGLAGLAGYGWRKRRR